VSTPAAIERTRIVVDFLVSVKEIHLAVSRRESERVGHPAYSGPGVHREEVEYTVLDGNAAPQRFESHSARKLRRMVGDAKEAPQVFDPDLDIELKGSVLMSRLYPFMKIRTLTTGHRSRFPFVFPDCHKAHISCNL